MVAWRFPKYPLDWSKISRAAKKRAGGRCESCGTIRGPFHAHHVVPLSKGGSSSLGNLLVLCESCHAQRHPHMRSRLRSHYMPSRSRSHLKTNTNYHPDYWPGASVPEEDRARLLKKRAMAVVAEENRRVGCSVVIVAVIFFCLFYWFRSC
jgi:hypothetical protein